MNAGKQEPVGVAVRHRGVVEAVCCSSSIVMWPTIEMKALVALVGSFLVSVSSTGLQSQASRMTVLSVLPSRCITASAE